MKECLGRTAKVRWNEAQTFFSVRSLSSEMKPQCSPFGHSCKNPLDFQFYGISNKDSTYLPEPRFHLFPRLQQLQSSHHMAWHTTAFLGSLWSWPTNSVKTRVQLRQILAVCVGPRGNYCHQKCKEMYCSAQANWKRFMKCFLSAQIPT